MTHKLDDEKEYYQDGLSVTSGNRLDLFKEYYESVTTADKSHALDTFKQFLSEEGISSGNLTDMWKSWLEGQGYSGNLSDMEKAFYEDN